MNRAGWKIFVTGEQVECGGVNILRRDLMRNIDDCCVRIDRENHSFHRADEVVLRAEVG